MHDTLRKLHGGPRPRGTTLDRFRLNEVVSQIAFGGRRGRVYRRVVTLSGVRPGDSVLDIGCSGGGARLCMSGRLFRHHANQRHNRAIDYWSLRSWRRHS